MSTAARLRITGLAVAAVVGAAVLPLGLSSASAATLLPAPVVLGPTDSSAQLKSVTLAWRPVPGAASYLVEVGTDEDWADTPTYSGTSVIPQLTLPTWLPHASYVWRVAAKSATGQGRWSASSPLGTFTRGWRSAPTGLTVTTDEHGVPTWTWDPVQSAAAYEVQFSTSPMFNDQGPAQTQATPVAQSCYTHRTRLSPFVDQKSHREVTAGACMVDLFVNGTPAYWRVRGLDLLDAPAQDVDTTPATDEGISHLPPSNKSDSVDFSDCPGTGSSPTPSPSPSPTDSAGPSPSASPSAAATSPCTPTQPVEKGAWSAVASYTPAWSALQVGDYQSLPLVQTLPLTDDPSSGCTGTTAVTCTDFPTLRWHPSVAPNGDTATTYRVYVSLDDSYSNIQRVIETPALEWTPPDSWRDSTATQSYFYVVQPCTAAGCGAVTNTPPSFKKRSPAAVPVGAQMVNGASVLTWHDYADTLSDAATARTGGTRVAPSSEAAAYHVQVTTPDNPDFQTAGLVDEATVDGALCSPTEGSSASGATAVQSCSAPATSYAARSLNDVVSYASSAKAYGDGNFLWRVQAVDASGHRLPWSPVGAFVRDATPPTASLTSASNVSVKPLLKVTFSEPVTGVSSSSLTLAGVSSNVVVLDDTHATIAPTRPLVPGASYPVLLSAAIKDLSANSAVSLGPVVTVSRLADDRSPALAYAGTWRAMASTNAISGGFHATAPSSSRFPTAANVTTAGHGVLVSGCMGPAGGFVKVYVDGVLRGTRDTYRSFSGCGLGLVRVTGLSAGSHRIQVRATGVHRAASRGTMVGLDAVTALP